MKDSENNSLNLEQKALQNCENEPIHDIGYIQPFGFLLAIDHKKFIITHVSKNLSDWFGCSVKEILGSHVNKFLNKEIIHQLNNALSHSTISTQREYAGRIIKEKAYCDLFVHKKQDSLIIELQPEEKASTLNINLLEKIQKVLERLRKSELVQDLMEQAVQELRFISGFNRVKAYKFLSDGAGEVIAESREQQVDSFLGLRFPSFDIPKSARELYATTPIRILPSIDAKQVPILSYKSSLQSLDLSLSILRGVVPVHSMYLKNMGVKATLSLPIVLDGKMWGLFAFHHVHDRMLSSESITSLEILGSTITMTLDAIIQKTKLTNIKECNRVASILFVPDESPIGYSAYWDSASSDLATLINCQGVSLLSNDKVLTYGTCPDEKTIKLLGQKLQRDFKAEGKNFKPIALDSISTKYPELDCGDIEGVFAIPNPATPFYFLFYFRMATDKMIRWAGNPKKDIQKSYEGVRLNPRASFTEYINSKQRQSDSFIDEEHVIGESLREALHKVAESSIMQGEHRKRLGLVIRELNHRVRNTLALVSSIVTQTSSSAHSLEEYIKALEIRILSLSETQKLLTEFDWQEVDITLLFERTLFPYKEKHDKRLIMKGPNLNLQPALASLLSLIINELSLNASKYGALLNNDGKIELNWEIAPGKLNISWVERDGPEVLPPTRVGFGTTLVKEALTYEFGAECSLQFLKKGLEAKFVIPLASEPTFIKKVTQKIKIESKENRAFNVLVLEDDFIIAKKLVATLKDLGAVKIDAAPNLEVVKRFIDENEYDIALLDVNIHGEYSGGIAKILERKDIPFAFVTGYGSKDQELDKFNSIAVLSKPINKKILEGVLIKAKLR